METFEELIKSWFLLCRAWHVDWSGLTYDRAVHFLSSLIFPAPHAPKILMLKSSWSETRDFPIFFISKKLWQECVISFWQDVPTDVQHGWAELSTQRDHGLEGNETGQSDSRLWPQMHICTNKRTTWSQHECKTCECDTFWMHSSLCKKQQGGDGKIKQSPGKQPCLINRSAQLIFPSASWVTWQTHTHGLDKTDRF